MTVRPLKIPTRHNRVVRLASPPPPSVPPPLIEPALLDIANVARYLAVSQGWVRDAARKGLLPPIKLGRLARWAKVDLDTFIERMKNKGDNKPGDEIR